MSRRVVTIVGVVAAGVLLGSLFMRWQWGEEQSPGESVQETANVFDIGITYLPLTRQLADYYSLGVASGVLVTEVQPGSPADRAGVKPGDVIISFNGTTLQDEPLFGMMANCPAGSRISLEVWRAETIRDVEMLHIPPKGR